MLLPFFLWVQPFCGILFIFKLLRPSLRPGGCAASARLIPELRFLLACLMCGLFWVSGLISEGVSHALCCHRQDKLHVKLWLQTGCGASLTTLQSVVAYILAFPFPSAFHTKSPSCHDTQASHKYLWYLWGYIPGRLENRNLYASLACSGANHRSIYSVFR